MSRIFPMLGCMLLAIALGCQGESTSSSDTAGESGSDSSSETVAEESSAAESTETNKEDSVTAEDGEMKNGLLRHAVFFSFKESSSEEDVQSVVDAFAKLPSQIEEIIDFDYGVNNSPEGHDDGFTHCFLLTFANEAGRATYLPHPAHKAFGDVLRPHMKSVFVIDYWGDPEQPKVESALHHMVFFQFKGDAAKEDVEKVEQAFAALPSKIEEIKAFEWGINNSPEKHDAGFTHCFLVTFDSEKGRETYLPHPDHKAFVTVLEPVLERVRVLDFTAKKP